MASVAVGRGVGVGAGVEVDWNGVTTTVGTGIVAEGVGKITGRPRPGSLINPMTAATTRPSRITANNITNESQVRVR